MMFNMFEYMFWRAEGFGYPWVTFEFVFFNNIQVCSIFNMFMEN